MPIEGVEAEQATITDSNNEEQCIAEEALIEVENKIDAHLSVEASDEAHVTKTVGDQTVHEITFWKI